MTRYIPIFAPRGGTKLIIEGWGGLTIGDDVGVAPRGGKDLIIEGVRD